MSTTKTRTVPNETLRAGQVILVSGYLSYSRLATQVAGEELAIDMQRRTQNNQIPIDRPYTTASIRNAAIIPANANGFTPEEMYVYESFYPNKTTGEINYTAVNKGNSLPKIAQTDAPMLVQGTSVKEIHIDKELASDLPVTLVLKTFGGKLNKNGVALECVIVHGEVRYFGNIEKTLAERGLIFLPDNSVTTATAVDSSVTTSAPAATQPVTTVTNSAPATQSMPNNFATQSAQPVNYSNTTATNSAPATQSAQPVYNNFATQSSPVAAQSTYFTPPMNYGNGIRIQ